MSEKTTPTNNNPREKDSASHPERAKCGIIMPISPIDGLLSGHWEDVKAILREAIDSAGFESELVSETEESTIIHKTIVHNLYNNPIVVCDVSGKNPNVMFELGMRLTFDKPTVVVKDDKTDYSFDMSPIEHVGYPRDLRFHQIVQFKEKLAVKVKATHDLAAKDPNYSTFLKQFGQFTVPKLEQKEVSPDQFIIKRLEELTQTVSRLERSGRVSNRLTLPQYGGGDVLVFDVSQSPKNRVMNIITKILPLYPDVRAELSFDDILRVYLPPSLSQALGLQLERILSLEIGRKNAAVASTSEDEPSFSGSGN